MITKNRMQELLIEGRRVNSHRYLEHCGTHHVKTFYFFCERLATEAPSVAVSSRELNDYILAQLHARKIQVNKLFNPQGWFGKAWTDWSDLSKNERNFKNEYREVLVRSGSEPYAYHIKPECLRDVIEIFDEFRVGASV